MTQLLPPDDSFTSIGTGNPGAPILYLNHRPRADRFSLGYLHSGYQGLFPQAPGSSVFTCGAAAPITQGAALDEPRGFCTRNEFGEDVTVTGVFRLASVSGDPDSGLLINMGVFARITSTNEASVNDRDVEVFDTSCYSLQLVPNTGGDFPLLVLRRYVAGTQLTLETYTFGQDPPAITAPVTLELEVATNGAQVDLVGRFRGWGVTGGDITLTHSDNTGDRITGGGRCGWSQGVSRLYAVPTSAALIELVYVFQIEEDGTGVVYRDEFDRVNLDMGADLNWDGSSFLDEVSYQTSLGPTPVNLEGQSLQQGYAWDLFTYEPFVDWPGGNGDDGAGKEFLTPGGVNRAFFSSSGSTSVNVVYAAIASRPASDPRSQHRSCDIEMSSTVASSNYAGGICLRASYVRPTTNPAAGGLGTFRGYAAVCEVQASQVSWEIRRYPGNGSAVTLAALTDAISGGTYFTAVDTPFSMDFECYTEGDPDEGSVVLILKVDGVQVPLIDSSSGTLTDVDGTVRDFGSGRIVQGAGEGMFFSNNEDNAANVVFYDNWAQQVIQEAPTKPEDMASLDFAGETTNAAGTSLVSGSLNSVLAPDFPFDVRRFAGTDFTTFDSGHQQTVVRWTDKATGALVERLVWTFSKPSATEAEYQALLDFWQGREGGVLPFNWTPPGSATTYACHFLIQESLEGLLAFKDTRSLAFKIQELKV